MRCGQYSTARALCISTAGDGGPSRGGTALSCLEDGPFVASAAITVSMAGSSPGGGVLEGRRHMAKEGEFARS